MANLTLSIDEEVLRRARIRALQQNTSVNALVRAFLESYAGGADERERAKRDVLEMAGRSRAASGREGRTWKREDIYEERVGRFRGR